MLVYGIIGAKVNLTLFCELNVMVNLVIRRVCFIQKFVSVRIIYLQYNVQPVAVIILRWLLSINAFLCLNGHLHIQKFCGKLICSNDVFSKLFLKINVSPMSDFAVIRQFTAMYANTI